jgi:hypothetical protein
LQQQACTAAGSSNPQRFQRINASNQGSLSAAADPKDISAAAG